MSQREEEKTAPTAPHIQSYDALAANYHESRYAGAANTWNESARRRGFAALLPPTAGRTLDVACGTGRGLLTLHDHAKALFGIDGTREMLQVAKRYASQAGFDPRVAQANAAKLPFADATFDLVTSFNFIHLFPKLADRHSFIREMGRVLKPGGTVIVEFDNALHGLVLGPYRKYSGPDIGYDWPWAMRAAFPADLFLITGTRGVNIPWIWRVPGVRHLESLTAVTPVGYLAQRVFIRAVRK
jgi:ubiquinone/menaquinone biosynthesis C-methylase UbiE